MRERELDFRFRIDPFLRTALVIAAHDARMSASAFARLAIARAVQQAGTAVPMEENHADT